MCWNPFSGFRLQGISPRVAVTPKGNSLQNYSIRLIAALTWVEVSMT